MMQHFWGFPISASAQAPQFDELISLLHWIMLAMFVGWSIFYVYVVMRFRKSKHPNAGYRGAKSKFILYFAFAIMIIEIGIDMGFSVPIWENRVTVPADKDAVMIRVVAEQFAWNIHYAGPDGKFGKTSIDLITPENPLGLDRTDPDAKDDITTINQLTLPVDKPVIIRLSSKDMVHSFFLPVMRVKQDAIPGLVIPVWFTPTRIGNYEIACAQLCGLGHYRMRGYLNILSANDYTAWFNDQEQQLAPPPAPAAKDSTNLSSVAR